MVRSQNNIRADWVDAAGNMITMPKPGAEGTSVTCTYDAWNRLASTSDGYDGLGRRVKKTVGATTWDFYYNENWQIDLGGGS